MGTDCREGGGMDIPGPAALSANEAKVADEYENQ